MESAIYSNYGEVLDSFGIKLRQLRNNKCLSLKDVEEKTGVSAGYICRLESGEKRAPTLPILVKLAKVYNISIFEMVEMAVEKEEIKKDIESEKELNRDKDIINMLIVESIKYNGEVISEEVKNELIEIIKIILNKEWNREKEKEILDTIDNVKALI